MKNKGWTKLYRAQFAHWISKKPFCDGYAWTYLYNQANHKEGMVNLRNEYIKVERGQFVTSKKKLQKFFGWTRRHLENFLTALENDQMLTYRMTHRFTVVTIVNYEVYQSNDTKSDTQNDRQMTHRRLTGDHKQECIKNDLRMKKKLSDEQIEENKKNITKSKKQFLDIVKDK
ncbi:unnamed protein product [marine sediment metagenome]|uniref:Uncharacterized protein n=1 Tax=marine sediment metagenome TaxID=412755 RepID=X1G009_9ZZZZ